MLPLKPHTFVESGLTESQMGAKCPWQENPYALVSLWDMRYFYAEPVLHLTKIFTDVENDLARAPNLNIPLSGNRQTYLDLLDMVQRECERINLTVALVYIRDSRYRVTLDTCTYAFIKEIFQGIRDRMREEMSTRTFLHIDPENIKYFEAKELFGADVESKFHSIWFDVREAGKCLALDRWTACVFHLMRVMEGGLRVVAKKLGIDLTANRSWDAMLKKIKSEAEELHPRDEWTDFYAEVVAKGYAVKDAWRNPAMHVGEKYTQEEADDIFRAVRGFMRHLQQSSASKTLEKAQLFRASAMRQFTQVRRPLLSYTSQAPDPSC